ncbi:unnamed protein product [Parnassius mnemosyne]|uniref:Uncharacterized protein n=1 Tax=Parnassius mnemosyne TaxID=213953 RepID=A0AAV1LHF7_9NEOP
MLQDTWRLNIEWDEYVPDGIYTKWKKLIDLLKVIDNIRIPRCHAMIACYQNRIACASGMEVPSPVPKATPPPAPLDSATPLASSAATQYSTTSYETVAVNSSATNTNR